MATAPLHIQYGEFVTFWKDVLEIVFRLGTLALPLPGLFLWTFLRTIGWTSLFQDSALSGSGLIYLIVVTLLFFGFVLLTFAVPSIIMSWSTAIYQGTTRLPSPVILVHLAAMFGWLISIVAVMPKDWPFWANLLAPATLSGIVILILHDHLGSGGCGPKWVTLAGLLLVSLLVVLSTAVPLLMIFAIARYFPDLAQSESAGALTLFWAIMLVGTIPGYFYLAVRCRSLNSRAWLGAAIGGLVIVGYFIAHFWMANPEIRLMISQAIGLHGNSKITFQVLNKEAFPAFDAVGIATEQAGELSVVSAFPTYRFGSVVLLCKEDPQPFARTRPDKVDAATLARNCVPVREADLRELRIQTKQMAPPAALPAPPIQP